MRTFRSLLCTAALAWLAACGPGTGGTGNGETNTFYLEVFGASASNVCTSPLGSTLPCADTTAGEAPASAPSTGTVVAHFTDRASEGATDLTITGNSAHLEAPCLGLRFDGDWGVAAAGDARFFGSYATAAAPTPVAATLAVDAVPGPGGALRVTLRQADGAVVLGPRVLSRVPTPAVEPAVCR
jgi:hypothetical protein